MGVRKQRALHRQARNSYIEWIWVHYKLLITQSLLVKVVRQKFQKIIWKSCLLLLEREQLQPACRESLKYSFIYLLSVTERFEWGIAAVKLRDFYARFEALLAFCWSVRTYWLEQIPVTNKSNSQRMFELRTLRFKNLKNASGLKLNYLSGSASFVYKVKIYWDSSDNHLLTRL